MRTAPNTSSTLRPRGALRFLPALMAGAGALTLAGAASAKPEFAEIVFDTVDMACPPPCTLCHTSSNGGKNTVRSTGFTRTIVEATGGDLAKNLATVLQYMAVNTCPNVADPGCFPDPMTMVCQGKCNADLSGKDDIAELGDGTNPNDATTFVCPAYGCGAHVAPTRPNRPNRPSDGTAVLGALGALLVLARRVRR